MVMSYNEITKFSQLMMVLIDIKKLIKDTWASSSAIAFIAIIFHQMYYWNAVILVLGIAIGYSYAYALNDYYDQPYDQENPIKVKLNIFLQNKYSNKFYLILLVIALFSMGLIFSLFGLKGWFVLGISLIIPLTYSAEPIRFKSRPVLDILIHALFVSTYPYVITIFLLGPTILPVDYAMVGILMVTSMSVQLENQIRDFEYDKLLDTNFTQIFGRKVSVYLMKALTAITILGTLVALLAHIIPAVIWPVAIALLPYMGHRLLRPINKPRSENLVKYTAFIILTYVTIFVFILLF